MDRLSGGKHLVNVALQEGSAVLTFDATPSEVHQSESDVTDFPVEEGADHTDHVRPKPIVFTMKAMISDFPIVIDFPNNQPANRTGRNSGSRVQDAYGFLEDARIAGDLVTVFTRLRTYDNMIVKKITVPRDAQAGQSATFDLTFRQISFGEVERTAAPRPSNPSRNGKENKGKKGVDEANASERRVSLLRRIVG